MGHIVARTEFETLTIELYSPTPVLSRLSLLKLAKGAIAVLSFLLSRSLSQLELLDLLSLARDLFLLPLDLFLLFADLFRRA